MASLTKSISCNSHLTDFFFCNSGGPQNCNGPTTVVTTVALPQAPTPVPLRHALPQSPVGVRPAPQLPRSPVRQHQLPTTPLQRSLVQQRTDLVQGSRLSPQLRTNGQQCIMVNPARTSHISMLPQNPTPGSCLFKSRQNKKHVKKNGGEKPLR